MKTILWGLLAAVMIAVGAVVEQRTGWWPLAALFLGIGAASIMRAIRAAGDGYSYMNAAHAHEAHGAHAVHGAGSHG